MNPQIYQGGLTGTWWCATRWRERPDGILEAITRYDVTDQIERIIAEALEAAGVAQYDGPGGDDAQS